MPLITEATPIAFSQPLPDAVDVVIIGAGIIGTSTAYFLAQRGVKVLLCEKGRVAGEQSSRNWGWIRQQGRDAAELPIVMDSINIWAGLGAEIDTDVGFERTGVLYLAETEKELAAHERWLSVAEQHQLDTRLLSSAEVDKLISGKPGQFCGGLYTPSDGRAEPFVAVPALARAAQRRGCSIRENCAVRCLDIQAGRVAGVATEHGQVRAAAVVCAGGAWSNLFAANEGIRLPQLTVRSTVARTSATADFFPGAAAANDIALRRRQDGGYTVAASGFNEHFIGADSFRYFLQFLPALKASKAFLRLRAGDGLISRLRPQRRWNADEASPFEATRVLNPAPSPVAVRQMHERLDARFPTLKGIKFEEAWAGMIDVTPDVVPVMDEVAQCPGLYLATGFSGHGFGIGPGAGKVMAEMVQNKPMRHDLRRFAFTRFADGSPMQPGPGL